MRAPRGAGDEAPPSCCASLEFEAYITERKLGVPISPVCSPDVQSEMHHLHSSLMSLVERASGTTAADNPVIRLNVALTEYGMNVGTTTRSYPSIPPHLHQAVREILDFGLKLHLNLALPDRLDRIWQGDMREYCRNSWETLDDDPHGISHAELLGMFLNGLVKWPFSRKRKK